MDPAGVSGSPDDCYFFLAAFCFLVPSFKNLMAFLGPPVPVILNFFRRCLL